MNNPRGECTLQLGNDQYRLSFSINSICDLERVTGKTVVEISNLLSQPEKLSLSFVRAFLWSGLQKYHPSSIEYSGELIEQHGLGVVMDKLLEAFAEAFPTMDNSRPTQGRKPAAGNGTNSLSTGSSVV